MKDEVKQKKADKIKNETAKLKQVIDIDSESENEEAIPIIFKKKKPV